MAEPIIINGVDVSGCIHYKNQTCIANYLFTNIPFSEAKCNISPNCHYKQLKRKEQKCEKYEACINDIKIINKDLLNDLCDNCGWYNTDGCDLDEDYVCESLIKIKQIINEVGNESV